MYSAGRRLARVLHERRDEAIETETHRDSSHARTRQAYFLESVEGTEREKTCWTRGSAAAVDIHEGPDLKVGNESA